jgi:hypothetical protein
MEPLPRQAPQGAARKIGHLPLTQPLPPIDFTPFLTHLYGPAEF